MHFLPYTKETLVMLAGYALGCFTSGYYIVRWWTGEDIHLLGSGGVGATNAGRALGWPGFLLTLSCDCFKGLIMVWLARYLLLGPTAVVLTMLAVVAGHIWPAQLWFRGGKGVATSLGALLMFDHSIALVFLALFLVVYALSRNFVVAGLLAFVITPPALFVADYPLDSVFGLSALALMVLIAHRKNIPEEIHKLTTGRKTGNNGRSASESK